MTLLDTNRGDWRYWFNPHGWGYYPHWVANRAPWNRKRSVNWTDEQYHQTATWYP